MNADERLEFIQYCLALSDAQLVAVVDDERKAALRDRLREVPAGIAEGIAYERGVLVSFVTD